jgi:hypothetical protein
MTKAPDSSKPNDKPLPANISWFSKHHRIGAVLLHGLWKLHWYHTVVFLWPVLIAAVWGASPYFMVYVVGMPEPGTAPRYVGTIRFEGTLQRTKTGWIPPRYFIQTDKGEVEFHCRYRPKKGECTFTASTGVKPNPDDVYEIGYDPYWGLDYIKYPPRLSKLNAYGEPKAIVNRRITTLYAHDREAAWLGFLLFVYLYLMWLTYQKSDPNQTPYPHVKPYPFDTAGSPADTQEPEKTAKPKLR